MIERSCIRCLFIYLGLLIICMAATAEEVPSISVKADTAWLIAGSTGEAVVTATVTNGSSPQAGAEVVFSCDPALGSFSRTTVATDGDGKAVTRFIPGTKSGSVVISAVWNEADGLVFDECVVGIDHAAPYRIHSFECEDEVTAGSTTEIALLMEDEYGNLIDDRRSAENVTFCVGSPDDGAHFGEGKKEITVQVDGSGEVCVTLTTDTVAGQNIVYVGFPGAIDSRYLTIVGLANGEPANIYQRVSPKVESSGEDDYPEQPLDKQFTIVYALYDQYGNVAGDRQIKVHVHSIAGSLTTGEWTVTTNSMGKAVITYGPSERAGIVDIVATAVDNTSVSCSQRVGFYSTTPTKMVLTAVPQTIASRDVKEDIVSHIKAKVIDTKGNPVRNESVSFRIVDVDVDTETYVMTSSPEISQNSLTSGLNGEPLVVVTDEDGFATIDFHPGAFTLDRANPKYNNMASGDATIKATWNGKSEITTVSFRNYPYLSVNTSVEPQRVDVNGTVNVTIQLIGDGWALHSKPIDVVLCTDRSGSMLKNTTVDESLSDRNKKKVTSESVDDRMVHAMEAAKIFTSQMKSSKDRIGLVSFGTRNDGRYGDTYLNQYSLKYWAGNDYKWEWHEGYWIFLIWHEGYWEWVCDSSDDANYIASHYVSYQKYDGYATRDLELNFTYKNVNATIDNWLPCGGTPMREGLYQSVQMILDHPRTSDDPVKAIVLLTDGEWTVGGSPEGGKGAKSFSGVGTGSVIQYAKDNGIKIYTIALGDEPSHDELRRYAADTGGKFYSATAGDDLTQVYEDIAQKLQEAAGVDTTMNLMFENVMINSTPTSDVFEYKSIDDVSTREVKYWMNNNSVFWGPKTSDQSEDWEDHTLSFEVGEIYLNQTWETTFCLEVKKPGNIDIFGDTSTIQFNGTQGKTELGLPRTFITAGQALNETNVTTANIRVDSLDVSEDSGILDLSWDLTYIGDEDVIQEIMYQTSSDGVWWDGTWQVADTMHLSSGASINGTYSSSLDQREKHGWYKIRILAREDIPEGVCDEVTSENAVHVEMDERTYIKLE